MSSKVKVEAGQGKVEVEQVAPITQGQDLTPPTVEGYAKLLAKIASLEAKTTKGTPKATKAEPKVKTPPEPHAPCVCGCGGVPAGKRSRFCPGHDARMHKVDGVASDKRVEVKPPKVIEDKPKPSGLKDVTKAYVKAHGNKIVITQEDSIRRNIPGEGQLQSPTA